MKRILERFADSLLLREQMRSIKGGWCYSYDCSCGDSSYNSWGPLSQYIADAQANCETGDPVSCTFRDLSGQGVC